VKYKFLLSVLAISALSIGCMGSGYKKYNQGRGYGNGGGYYQRGGVYRNNQTVERERSFGTNSASQELKGALEYMYDEERLAKDIYLALYSKYRLRQLYRIATNSETRHIDAVKRLAQKYGVPTPNQRVRVYRVSKIQNLYNQLYSKGIRSQRDALEVGCMVEVTDIDDLEDYIATAQRAGASDVVQTFDFLKRGSYNHYWAFDRALKQMGVSEGCCSLGREYCHPEYPQNKRGGGRGRGGRMGMGHGRGGGGGGWR
jgi:hypothetical protein